jgi:hypothetical protein
MSKGPTNGATPGGKPPARGRPKKHLTNRDRTAAWRERHRLRKVTVDVPERHVAELRRLAWSFRSEDESSLLRQKWENVGDTKQILLRDVIIGGIIEETQRLNHRRPFRWAIIHDDAIIAEGFAASELISKELVERSIRVYAAEVKYILSDKELPDYSFDPFEQSDLNAWRNIARIIQAVPEDVEQSLMKGTEDLPDKEMVWVPRDQSLWPEAEQSTEKNGSHNNLTRLIYVLEEPIRTARNRRKIADAARNVIRRHQRKYL